MRRRIIMLVSLAVFIAAFIGFGREKADVNGTIDTLLHVLLTCPNDELYDSKGAYISLEDSEVGSTEEDLERDKNAWKEAVGECFAESRFDSFYGQWERTAFLGKASVQGDSIELKDIEIEEGDDLVKTIKAIITVSHSGDTKSDEIQTTWIITLDNSGKIQKIELKDDGGYL